MHSCTYRWDHFGKREKAPKAEPPKWMQICYKKNCAKEGNYSKQFDALFFGKEVNKIERSLLKRESL